MLLEPLKCHTDFIQYDLSPLPTLTFRLRSLLTQREYGGDLYLALYPAPGMALPRGLV